jgi:aryl-alcohol dehydrogenase-like predicted oxidoreductase
MMKYGNVAGVDKKISRICQGGIMFSQENLDHAFALMDAAREIGINCIDCAWIYGGDGDCEKTIGKWVASRGNRDEFVMFDKGAHPMEEFGRITPEMITEELKTSLDRLKFDYIDIYCLHRDDLSIPVDEMVDCLNEHKDAGLINAFGGSNWTSKRVAEANAWAKKNGKTGFAVSSPQFSLAEMYNPIWWGCLGLGGAGQVEDRKFYADNDIPIFSWSSIGCGFFTGKVTSDNAEAMKANLEPDVVKAFYGEENFRRLDRAYEMAAEKGLTVTQMALAYVLNQAPLKTHPFVGPLTVDEVKGLEMVIDVELTAKETAWLDLQSDER